MHRLPLDDCARGSKGMRRARPSLAASYGHAAAPVRLCRPPGDAAWVFSAWASIAALLSTPAMVWLAADAGGASLGRLLRSSGVTGWISRIARRCPFVLLKAARPLATTLRSRPTPARLARSPRWEFWPMGLFYAPVAIWVFLLAVRHRGLSTITASNPGIPDGGVVGESKFRILTKLPSDCTIPSALVEAGPAAHRVDSIVAHMREQRWALPVVLKPDVGQRGVGVRLAQSVEDLKTYCEREASSILMQPYHPGPFEAGIFYYRLPGEARGRIFSITDKHFPGAHRRRSIDSGSARVGPSPVSAPGQYVSDEALALARSCPGAG